MARFKPISDDALFHESQSALDEARVQLAKGHVQRALEHFQYAFNTSPREDVIAAIQDAADKMDRETTPRLLLADYYLAGAEFTHLQNRQDATPFLRAALQLLKLEATPGKRRIIDHVELAKRAISVFRHAPGDRVEGLYLINDAKMFFEAQYNAIARDDSAHGTAVAPMLMSQLFVEQALKKNPANRLLGAFLQGYGARPFQKPAARATALDKRSAKAGSDETPRVN